ncbi:MAG: Type 1 glutamine amidotransferase-like domain-containing protein [Waterburya sp.]
MKLALFSDQNQPKIEEVGTKLIHLIGKSKPAIGYISSCPDPSRKFYNERKEYYSQFGAILTPYVDLESGFNSSCLDLVFQADAIHLSGGNTYQFLYWIIKRGLRERLHRYANSGKVIIGVSAGSIIMTPNISYSELCEDRNDIGLGDLKGLTLVDFHFVPHVLQGEIIAKDILLKSQQDSSKVVVACDYDWIIIDEAKSEVFGQPKLIVNGAVTDIKYL